MPTINQMEAGAFYTHCAMRRLTSAQALAELAITTWKDMPEDLAFGRRRHTPTIRRLAKPLLKRLDAELAARRRYDAEIAADRATWAALPAGIRSEIRAAAHAAHGNEKNRRVRVLAIAHGITVMASDISRLRTLVDE